MHEDWPGTAVALWTDRGWPVMAGTLAGVGLVAAWSSYGAADTLLVLTCMASFGAMVTFGVLLGRPDAGRSAARCGPAAGLVAVALLGLGELLPGTAWLPLVLVGATSPPAIRFARRSSADRARREPSQATVDRAFARIVDDLRRSEH